MNQTKINKKLSEAGRVRMLHEPNTGSDLSPISIVEFYPKADNETKFKYVRAISNRIVDQLRQGGMTFDQARQAAMNILSKNGGLKKSEFDYDKFYDFIKALYVDNTYTIGRDGKLQVNNNPQPVNLKQGEVNPNKDLADRLLSIMGQNTSIEAKQLRQINADLVSLLRKKGFSDDKIEDIIEREFKKYTGYKRTQHGPVYNIQPWLGFAHEILNTGGKYFDDKGNVRLKFNNWRGRQENPVNTYNPVNHPGYQKGREDKLAKQIQKNLKTDESVNEDMEMNNKEEVTMYSFESHLKSFLKSILTDPVNGDIDDFFKENGISKSNLIKSLKKMGMLEVEEKIDDETGQATMKIQYKVPKKNFDRNLRKLYIRYFERNVPPRQKQEQNITEDGEAPMAGATNTSSSGQYSQPVFPMQRRKIYATEDLEKMVSESIKKYSKLFESYSNMDDEFRQRVEDALQKHKQDYNAGFDRRIWDGLDSELVELDGRYIFLQLEFNHNTQKKEWTLAFPDLWFDNVRVMEKEWFGSVKIFIVELNKKYNIVEYRNKLRLFFENQWCDGIYTKTLNDYIYAHVEMNNKWNAINKYGELVSPNVWFDSMSMFDNIGWARVKLNNKWNFLNIYGNYISPNKWFDDCDGFNIKGYGTVVIDGKKFIINKEGNLATNLSDAEEGKYISFDDVENMNNNKKNKPSMFSWLRRKKTTEGKEQQERKRKGKKIIVSEEIFEQFKKMMEEEALEEATTTFNTGDYTYTAPAFVDKETANRKPGFSCERKK